jgi:hypothetical protein
MLFNFSLFAADGSLAAVRDEDIKVVKEICRGVRLWVKFVELK